ncbi:signal peptidase I [Gordonia sp. HY442]|uniref:signal peptidase I n=1 Tax=Gordonia zhenghanii TaxID=2911516 RepID=UPI001F00AD44|nr:signal peptidase I [Gordonia zhenghanii]MCF8606782.1 signal peptidase I [Gordonia zhenghanii]
MNSHGEGRRGRIADLALTVSAVVGVVCIVSTLIALVLGVRPVVFETGSMAPTIPTGSLGISKTVPATDLNPGDVVGVIRDDGVRVTHRVVSIDGVAGNSVTLTMRGDGNNAPDHDVYVVTEGTRVFGSVPVLGYVASWLQNPYTLVLQVLAALFLLAVAFAPANGWRRSTTAQRLRTGTATASVVVIAASGLHLSGNAQAALPPNQATATGSLAAVQVNAPASLTCKDVSGLLFKNVVLTWPVPAEQRGVFTYNVMSGTTSLGTAGPTTQDSQSFTITVGLITSLLSAILGSTFSVHVVARIGNWTSSPTGSQSVKYRALLPSGPECVTPDTPAAKRAAPTSSVTPGPSASTRPSEKTQPPESASPTDSTEESAPTASTAPGSAVPTSTSQKPELPAGGTSSASAAYSYYQEGSQVTIRDTTSTDVVYRDDFSSGSDVRWLPGTDDLQVTAPDGTVTVVSTRGGQWTANTTAPAPSTTDAPPAEAETTAEAEQPAAGDTAGE